MTLDQINQQAEEIAKQYNPENLSAFPFENIQNDKKDFRILLSPKLPSDVSGMTAFLPDQNIFTILINETKPATRQYFTIAHELGHYFLHQEEIKKDPFVDKDNVLDSANTLFRRDIAISTQLETEANNFAASLLMPTDLVKKAWGKLGSVEECAEIFKVSIEAMSIRLSRLGLIN